MRDRAIVTMEHLEIMGALSKRVIPDDLVTFKGHFGDPLSNLSISLERMKLQTRNLVGFGKCYTYEGCLAHITGVCAASHD